MSAGLFLLVSILNDAVLWDSGHDPKVVRWFYEGHSSLYGTGPDRELQTTRDGKVSATFVPSPFRVAS